jgi:hypothetical protein
MRATLPMFAEREQEHERWPIVVNAPADAEGEQVVTVFSAMAIWIGLELAVIGVVFTVV